MLEPCRERSEIKTLLYGPFSRYESDLNQTEKEQLLPMRTAEVQWMCRCFSTQRRPMIDGESLEARRAVAALGTDGILMLPTVCERVSSAQGLHRPKLSLIAVLRLTMPAVSYRIGRTNEPKPSRRLLVTAYSSIFFVGVLPCNRQFRIKETRSFSLDPDGLLEHAAVSGSLLRHRLSENFHCSNWTQITSDTQLQLVLPAAQRCEPIVCASHRGM